MKLETGEKCKKGGIYECDNCGHEISVGINNVCPPCSECNGTNFTLTIPSN